MKIILLPGMDGTGKLFEPFCAFLPASTIIVPLPQHGPQTYQALTDHIAKQLPNEEFIIVAESFSGPIAAMLAGRNLEYLKGIVFVATFLQCPKPALVSIAKFLPLKFMLGFPFAEAIISHFLLAGFSYSMFSNALKNVPSAMLKERLNTIAKLKPIDAKFNLPSLYVSAKFDCFVPVNQVEFFKQRFENIKFECINGTHFLLQSNPKDCSAVVGKFIGIC